MFLSALRKISFRLLMSILAIVIPIMVAVILVLMVVLFSAWRQRRREKADQHI